MLAFLLTLSLALSQDPSSKDGKGELPPPPTAEQVASMVATLDEAFSLGDAAGLQAAFEAALEVPHASVARKLDKGLLDERMEVRLAALQALRWIRTPEAVDLLQAAAKGKLMKDPEQAAAILRGLGQHAEARSIPVLAQNPFLPDTFVCKRARLFGLARIRTRESLEALIGILSVTGSGPSSGKRRIQDQIADMRTALIYVTGLDLGDSPEMWEEWWRKNKKTLRLPEVPPTLPEAMQAQWDGFFGLSMVHERRERREDRGH